MHLPSSREVKGQRSDIRGEKLLAMDRGEGGQKGQHGATAIFGKERRELKLGKSFQKDNNGGFHTIRCT